MGLTEYKRKRNFKKTSEPSGDPTKNKNSQLHFVVQKHHASHLHYDFRLELNGVLKSWAVPKGPSLNPDDKRLAMMVEDHPYDYKDFEGIIPKGNYGAGSVIVWDEGTYTSSISDDYKESVKNLNEGLRKGDLKFILNGKKLKGEFALVHMKSAKSENSWLLIKKKDKHASKEDVTKNDRSVKTGITNSELEEMSNKLKLEKKKERKSQTSKRFSKKTKSFSGNFDSESDPFPHNLKPMLAKLSDRSFDDPDWLFEIKWDGYRAVAEIENGNIYLHSRNLISFDEKFSEIRESLKEIDFDAVLDGEVVAVDKEGNVKFQNIQNYWRIGKPASLLYYVFDMLYYRGKNLTDLPLIERKNLLQEILPDLPNVRYSDHILESGIAFFKAAEEKKIEGIIAKEKDSKYYPGKRSSSWLKIKTEMRQEVVIAGFTAPRGSRKEFGALILGVYDEDELKYVGHSGGGFNNAMLKETKKKLKPLIQEKSPFREKVKTNAKVTWVKPKLVGEVKFSEWTNEGNMRHPVFLGFREDKEPGEVHFEKIENPKNKNSGDGKRSTAKAIKNNTAVMEADGVKVEVSNPEKIYWPKEKITKLQLVEYYNEVAEVMLPYLIDRPQSLNRFPNGINGESFFQKDIEYEPPVYVKTVKMKSKSSDKGFINYMLCQNKATLLYMANLGCIEINPWNSKYGNPENPDYIVIDIDPAKEDFDKVIDTALAVKEVLNKGKIKGYCKTSGASGLHVYIPLGGKYDYDIGKNFAELISRFVQNLLPGITSIERMVTKRKKKIYVDFLQNRKGQTLASVYSVRPKPGATVSTPLEWSELKHGLHPSDFTIFNISERIKNKGDLFQGLLKEQTNVETAIQNLER